MASVRLERVLEVNHWSKRLFSFRTTRDPAFRFESGHFVMLGLMVDGRPLMRAYSIASPSYAEDLEFLSIKVEDGLLTSRLQHLKANDEVIVSNKPVGTLVLRNLRAGRTLFLLATGTGLAPFVSIVQDPETYERFDTVVLAHGVRTTEELAYARFIEHDLAQHPLVGKESKAKLLYYPAVTRESFRTVGRLTELLAKGQMTKELQIPALDPALDRAMICGSVAMLRDMSNLLDQLGLKASPGSGEPGDYVVERAFAEA